MGRRPLSCRGLLTKILVILIGYTPIIAAIQTLTVEPFLNLSSSKQMYRVELRECLLKTCVIVLSQSMASSLMGQKFPVLELRAFEGTFGPESVSFANAAVFKPL